MPFPAGPSRPRQAVRRCASGAGILAMLALLPAGCSWPGSGHGSTAAAAVVLPAGVTMRALPTGLDAGAPPALALVAPASVSRHALVVFLTADGRPPAAYRNFLGWSAGLGYPTIGLPLPADPRGGCDGATGCPDLRRALLDGEGGVPGVPRGRAVEPMLLLVLRTLAAAHPTEGWPGFLGPDGPTWSRIIVAGDANGASEAAWAARTLHLRGAVLFAGPQDGVATSRGHSNWLAEIPWATPSYAIVAFIHVDDPMFRRARTAWRLMRLDDLSTATIVDADTTPFDQSHELMSAAVLTGTDPRAAPVLDAGTPRCADGSPEFRYVWRYLLETAARVPVTRNGRPCP